MQENKICHCFHVFPTYLLWSDGTRCHGLCFLSVDFIASFFTLPFSLTLIKRLFSSYSLFAIRVISSAYLTYIHWILINNLELYNTKAKKTIKMRWKKYIAWNFLAVQWLRLSASTAEGTASSPGQQTSILQVAFCGQNVCIYVLPWWLRW